MAERFLVTISRSVSFLGKAWCSSMLLLRLLLVSLAAFSLFGDEQERFVCNTIQPGCSSACFDVFAPVSVLRLWLFQLLLLSLPHLLFACYVLHRAAAPWSRPASRPGSSLSGAALPLEPPSFHCSYLLLVLLRLLLELLFGAAQFLLFGLSVPKSFLCYEAPCTSGVQCYVSRPTEKSLMLGLMLAVASSSVLLSLLDLLGSLRAALGRRALLDQLSRGERSSVFTSSATEDTDVLPSRRTSPSGTSKSWTSEHKPAAGLFLSQEKHPDGQRAKPPVNPLAQLRPPLTPRPERDPITPGPKPDGSETRDKRAWV